MADPTPQERRRARRQVRKDLWISLLAVVSVMIGLYDMARPRATTAWRWYDVLDLVIVLVFIVDFGVSAHRSGSWARYAKKHWYEIPALIPLTGNMVVGAGAVPLLRGLRLVRLVRVLRLLRLAGTLGRMEKFWRKAVRVADRAGLGRLAIFAAIAILGGASLAWILEGHVNERMGSPADALWWALNMFSNVAYVDFQPATPAGKVVAAVLEFMGIAFIGIFAAALTNALVRDEEGPEPEDDSPLD